LFADIENSPCSLFVLLLKTRQNVGRENMTRPMDTQMAALLLVGWLVALVTTLT
jgi:hypothetical protein